MERTVISAAVGKVLENLSIWKKVHDNYVISLPSAFVKSSPPERLAELRIAGYIFMLHILWTKASPADVSPAFLLAIVCGQESIVNLPFVQEMDSDLAKTLRPWPLDNSAPLVQTDEIRNLICYYLNLQV